MTTAKHDGAAKMDARRYDQLIDGRSRGASGGATYERKSPIDGALVETIAWGGVEDVELAVAAARTAFDHGPWPRLPAAVRAGVLQRVAAHLRERSQYFSALITEEMGKPISTSAIEVNLAAEAFDYYAGLALDLRGESASHYVPSAIGLTVPEAVGVVGVITPWNFPLLLTAWKLAPALAVGCTVVAKPSELAAGCIFELARALQHAGLPEGVLNVITGPGDVMGAAIAKHPRIDKISFTGSTAVGKSVLAAASHGVKRVSLELGGKCANIVFADADIQAAIGGAIAGAYLNAGQVCMAGSRLLIDERIKEPFLHALASAVKGLPVGDPRREDVFIGPVVSEPQRRRVLDYIAIGQREGASLLVGGGQPKGGIFEDGLYVEPTIFTDVLPSMRLAREEVFGPVLSVLTFKTTSEALALANDSEYGLAAAVWTKDIDRAIHAAKAIRAGTIWINAYHSVGMSTYMPFGGYKQSGLGREAGRKGLEEYLETKSIHINIGAAS